ncbi:hypothetical protein BDV25DRAFT_132689 [Aspergillus avenaceus]|uniref:F-box domain-containing protein n=1 Tax=Aspergillus avenaceus TaxID=36643 RepID=A0A5N6TK47_ASPAV|nr:hypothetical protein BDV25DRAFT_132689 [Aspergillus avenaceus]
MGSLGLVRGEAAALQQHGQNLYQTGSFQAAIDAFTEALKTKSADQIGILDNRAATYTKLAQYDRALKDAKQMIKIHKQDERGYLRCAKALLLDGKHEKALEIYAYALKTLSSNHPRREIVEQLHNKLRDKLTVKACDPFSVLPLEIATMILQYFDFKQIVAILRVSKQWDRFLSSIRDLWMRVDLSGARNKVHWSSVRACIRRSKALLTHAIVKNLSTSSSQRVLEFFGRCPRLEYLEIWTQFGCQAFYDLFRGSRRLKTLIISGQMVVPQEYIVKFLESLPLLERLEIHKTKTSPSSKVQWPSKLPHLRTITFGTTEGSWPRGHTSALYIPRREESLPYSIANLEEVRLDSDPNVFVPYPPSFNPLDLSRLRRLDLSGVFVGDDFGLPSSIEYLRIRGGAATEEFPFSNELPFELPHLKTLIFSDVPWVSNNTLLVFILEAKAPIKVLHVDSCFRLHGAAFAHNLCEHAQDLTELNLSHIIGINDSITSQVVDSMPDLKALDLSYTDITGISIKMLVDAHLSEDHPMKIECIYTRGCEHVSSDAIAYGRASGIEIIA